MEMAKITRLIVYEKEKQDLSSMVEINAIHAISCANFEGQ